MSSEGGLNKDILAAIKHVMLEEIAPKLDQIRIQLSELTKLNDRVEELEQSYSFLSGQMDTLINTTLPNMVKHYNECMEGMVMQNLCLDVHRRKWNLLVYGLDGPADENETETRKKCLSLAHTHLKLSEANLTDFAACHRLGAQDNDGIIIRFVDLDKRNKWLMSAKNLKNSQLNVSISPDLPPTLRPLKKDLLAKRKTLDDDTKRTARIRYLAAWPFIDIKIPGKSNIVPSVTKASVVKAVTGRQMFNPASVNQNGTAV